MIQANRGSGGVDGQSLDGFATQLDQQLDRLQSELKEDVYRPQPVRQVQIPKAGKPGEFRTLGIPTIYDRVCQQALLNRRAEARLQAEKPGPTIGNLELQGEWGSTSVLQPGFCPASSDS